MADFNFDNPTFDPDNFTDVDTTSFTDLPDNIDDVEGTWETKTDALSWTKAVLQMANKELGAAAAVVDSVELQDLGQTAKEASDMVERMETTLMNDTPLNLRELRTRQCRRSEVS